MLSKTIYTAIFVLLAVVAIIAKKHPIEIVNSGSTNTPGYRVEIEHNGNVHYYIAPRRVGIISLNGGTNGTAKLSRKTTKDLYHHIKQCEPFNKLTIETCLKSVSFGFSLKLIYNGQTTPDLTCPTNNTHLENLAKVVNSVISE
ncbi:unnamed protein product [Rotaria socialis]|uniref:Uncharacterized protein n=1 Tax=Rotaria socialis TaxID=392032 RepID=A0A820S9H7_9BILA|nr:unnamed protein product [Rotaria socialis]CAF4454599.1 unnamed protein product [Rotaria socialis]